jgi:hypothetical protein
MPPDFQKRVSEGLKIHWIHRKKMLKEKKIRSKAHRRFIASLPCVICSRADTQAAHIRAGNNAGIGLKSGDDCCVPLCIECHRKQHELGSEAIFWLMHDSSARKATVLAKSLFAVTGDREKASTLIGEWR